MKRSRSTGPTGTQIIRRETESSRVPRTLRSKTRSTPWKDKASLGMGFPKMLKMTHKYVDTVALSSTLGVINFYSFSTNGMFDPNISGTGHQPYYFDQLSAIYDHYCVIGSKIKFTVINSGNTDPAYGLATFVDDDTTTTATTLDEVVERQTGKLVKVAPANNTRTLTLTETWSAKKYFGKDPLDNDELQGTIAANPVEQSYFKIAVQANSTGNVTCVITAEIEFIAVWKEIHEITQS